MLEIMSNWSQYIGPALIAIVAINAILKFLRLPVESQKEKIKELLLAWVTEAERSLGGGTGPIKLRIVYDKFVSKFPYISKIVSFSKFSQWVDDALDTMEELLKDERIARYVKDEN